MNTPARPAGFTLIELMITIAVLAILAAIAAPNMSDVLDRRRVAAAAEEVHGLVQLGRTEAIKQSRNVRVTISEGAAGQWFVGLSHGGVDCIDAASCQINLGGTPITRWVNSGSGTFGGVAMATTHPARTFNPRGVTTETDDTTITLTSERNRVLIVTINPAGRVSAVLAP